MSIIGLTPLVNTNTFGQWKDRTNEIIESLEDVVTIGDAESNVGNIVITGNIVTSNTLISDTISPYNEASNLITLTTTTKIEGNLGLDNTESGITKLSLRNAGDITWEIGTNVSHDSLSIGKGIVSLIINESTQSLTGTNITIDPAILPGNVTTDVTGNILAGNGSIVLESGTGISAAIFTGNVEGNVSGNAGTVTNGVYTTGNQTIAGTKTFSSTISGSINGNSSTVTNGVYTTGNQTIAGTKTFSSTITGSISGNAETVTDGVYTTGNQTIAGTKTFSSLIAGSINGNAATVTNGVYTTGNQTIAGTKTFSSTISGSINGNAATVTNGVYTNSASVFTANKRFNNNLRLEFSDAGNSEFWHDGTNFYLDVNNDAPFYLRDISGAAAIRFTFALASGDFAASGEVTAYGSDERLKENIRTIDNALEKVKSLDGVFYDWKDMVENVGFRPTRRKDEAGVLAQQVQKVLPQAVSLAPFDAGEATDGTGNQYSISGENYLTVKYEKLAPLLIEAIKEQDLKVEAQAKEIDYLRAMVQKLLNK